jgi:hypothetical protein
MTRIELAWRELDAANEALGFSKLALKLAKERRTKAEAEVIAAKKAHKENFG